MKAIILAAGYGSRLLPLTSELPKCLVPVGERSILAHQFDALYEAGVREAVVIGGYRHWQVAEFLHAPHPIATSLIVNPFWSVANSIGSVWCAKAHLAEPFLLMNGDTVFDRRVLAEALNGGGEGVGLLVERSTRFDHDDMRVRVADGRVRAVSKDLAAEEVTHRSLGVIASHGTDGAYVRALDAVITGEEGQARYHHKVVDVLASGVGVAAIEHKSGHWQEIDRPEDIALWNDEALARTRR